MLRQRFPVCWKGEPCFLPVGVRSPSGAAGSTVRVRVLRSGTCGQNGAVPGTFCLSLSTKNLKSRCSKPITPYRSGSTARASIFLPPAILFFGEYKAVKEFAAFGGEAVE